MVVSQGLGLKSKKKKKIKIHHNISHNFSAYAKYVV